MYYKVLLRPKRRQNDVHPVLLRTTKYYSSTTPYYKVLPRTTKYYSSTTPYYKVLLQYYSVLQTYYKVLPRTTKYYSSTTPYYKVLLQYYSVLQTYYKVLLRTTEYYSSTTPYYKVVQKLPKRAFRARLPQLFNELASKTSISCEASSTFQGTSFQNEHFVRGFLNFSRNKLPKRAFRARLPQLFKEQASKTSISCEASSTFQGTSFQNEHFRARLPQLFKEQASKTSISCEASATFQATSFQNEHFVRGFRNFSSDKLPKRAFRARLPQLFKEQASKTSISYEASSTFQSRSFQSLAPATQNAKMTSHLESLKRQNEHFVRYFLQISHFELENRRFCASFSYKAIFTELKKYDFFEASATSATFQDNHQILRLPRYLQ